MLKTIAGAAVLLASVSAYAADHPQPLGVWDSEGMFVGNYVSDSAFEALIKGMPMLLPYSWHGFTEGLEIVYTQPNCAGQGYLSHDAPILSGGILSGQIYYPGPRITVTQASIGFEKPGGQSACSAISAVPVVVGPILTTPLPVFHPPFCVSPHAIRCQ